jgi:protein-tyrosine phosphatase
MLDFDEILAEQLWVGGRVYEDDMPQLRRIGITTVVSLQTDEDLFYYGISPDGLLQAYRDAGIELRRVPTPDFDREALRRNLPQAVAQVAEALTHPGVRLYLHCSVGVNRSPTTAAGFLIQSRGIPAREACNWMISRRDCSPSLDILEEFATALRDNS